MLTWRAPSHEISRKSEWLDEPRSQKKAVLDDVTERFEVAIVGAGSVGIAVAYYLVRAHGIKRIVLIDSLDPMSLTSAQSGENHRNWWPHPVMTASTDHSITLLEEIDRAYPCRQALGAGRRHVKAFQDHAGHSTDCRHHSRV